MTNILIKSGKSEVNSLHKIFVNMLRKLNERVYGNRLAQDFNVSKSTISYLKSKKTEGMATVGSTYQKAKKVLAPC